MVLLGNVVFFIGCILMVGTGFIKKKSSILAAQCIQFGIQGVGHLILGSVSGGISCCISVVRNLIFTKAKVTVWLKLAFIAVQAFLTLISEPQSLIQWLPLVAVVPYTWFLDTENVTLFKFVNIFGCACWTFHDFYYRNYSGTVFDVLTIITTTAGVFMLLRDKKQSAEQKSADRSQV